MPRRPLPPHMHPAPAHEKGYGPEYEPTHQEIFDLIERRFSDLERMIERMMK